jgi:F420-non-reducing hydrogenase iron-sulfur subunit
MEGDCHYLEGNLNAKRRVAYVQTLLEQVGIDGRRVRMLNISSAMGRGWADAVTAMDETLRALGPNPLKIGGPRETASGGERPERKVAS